MADQPSLTMEQRRETLVAEMRATLGAHPLSPAVEAAFLEMPRHLFVPGVYLDAVYHNNQIVVRRNKDGLPLSASTRPSAMAMMLDGLDIQPGQRVLEIGTGTGYNAAVLAELVGPEGQVVSVELEDDLAEAAQAHLERAGYTEVYIVQGDGADGVPQFAPYDRIIVTASVWDVPDAWVEQLADDGILVLALTSFGLQIGAALRKEVGESLVSRRLFPVTLIPLQGRAAGPERHIFVPGYALRLDFMSGLELDAASLQVLLADESDVTQLPLELDRHNLGLLSYYLLFHRPPGYEFVTYTVEEGQMAFGMEGIGWGLVSSTSACFVPYGDQRIMHLFGSGEAGYYLIEMAHQWHAAGRPGLDDCRLRITPAGQKPRLPDDPAAIVRVAAHATRNYALWLAARDES